jgi:hypothetical protein
MSDLNTISFAADNENSASGERSWFQAAADGTVAVAASAYYGAKNSVGSIFNAVDNLMTGQDKEYEDESAISSLRDKGFGSAADFYQEHQQGVDTLGLIAGGIIPGTAGVKVYRALSQSVRAMDAFGLTVSRMETLRKEAKYVNASSNAVFNPLQGATMKAIASGYGAQAMEALAYEIAALSTTLASPMYEGMDATDIAWNTLKGGLVGGGIMGSFSAAKTYYGVKKAVGMADMEKVVGATGTKFLPASDNIVRAKATDASNLAEEITRFGGGDGGITPQLHTLIKKQTVEATHSMMNLATGVSRLDEGEAAGSQILDLQTGAMFHGDAAISGGIADSIPGMRSLEVAPKVGVIFARDAEGKAIERIAMPTEVATVKDAQAAYLLAAHTELPTSGVELTNFPMVEKLLQEGRFEVPVNGRLWNRESLSSALDSAKKAKMGELSSQGVPPEDVLRILNLPENGAQALWDMPMDAAKMLESYAKPRYARISYDMAAVNKAGLELGSPTFGAQAIARAEQVARAHMVERHVGTAAALREVDLPHLIDLLPEEQLLLKQAKTASRVSEAAGKVSFADGNYDTLGATAQAIGRMVQDSALKLKSVASDALRPHVLKIADSKDLQDALILVTEKLRLTDAKYVIGERGIERLDVALNRLNPAEAAIDKTIDAVKNPERLGVPKEVEDFLKTHSEINLKNRKAQSALATVRGGWDVLEHERHAGDFVPVYVPPVDMNKTNYFVLVRHNPMLVGRDSNVSAIIAHTAEALQEKIDNVKNAIQAEGGNLDHYEFLTKKDTAEYHKAHGDYIFSKGINESRIDSTLRKAGVMGEARPLLTMQDSRAGEVQLNEYLAFHERAAARTVRDIVESRYAEAFAQLKGQGADITELETSRALASGKKLEENLKNPYLDHIKTALNLSTMEEHHLWAVGNRFTENLGSKALATLGDVSESFMEVVRRKGKSVSEAELDAWADKTNKVAEAVGMPGVSRATEAMFGDVINTNPSFSRAVSRGNALISTFTLGIEVLNHLTNIFGSAVLQNAEMGSVLNAIAKKDTSVAGKLAHVNIPEIGGSFLAPTKLLGTSIKRFFTGGEVWGEIGKDSGVYGWVKKTGSELVEDYKSQGFVTEDLHNMKQIVDNLSFTGAESAADLNRKVYDSLMAIGEKGRKWSGGNFAERFTRFLAVDGMRQITDKAMEQGIMASKSEANVYLNTALNRIQGNTVAAQRPVMFQGNIGQAVGLFMTYQVNLMQQLFRHAGSGDKRAAVMLLGTQTAIFGMQGLPGWDAINQHIIADASGNTSHADLYSASNSLLGKDAAEWVLYGAGSNILGLASPELKTNMFTRGDINPRQLTVIPTSPEDTILYKATLGFMKNIKNTAQNISNGAPLDQAFYQALQQNGISRALSGVGTILAGASYDSQGKRISSLDESLGLLNLSNAVRLAGGKPMTEAIASDAVYRSRAYEAWDSERRKEIARAVRLEAADGTIDPDKWHEFAGEYAKAGGNPEQYRKFILDKMKDQSEDVVARTMDSLRKPVARNFAAIVGADSPAFEQEE